jgi:acyl-CoA reductase-like NAD-dependent aldehyde dehydrogenase
VGVIGLASAGQAVAAARELQNYRPSLSAYERAEILDTAATAIHQDRAEFSRLICAESGIALRDCAREVARAVGQLRFCAEESKRITGEAIPTDVGPGRTRRFAVTVREPVGVVLAITPFNRPLNQVVTKVAPAIAANNRVLVKPSEKAPLSAVKFVATLLAAGLPAEMISLVTGTPEEVVPAVLESGFVDMLTFTGSSAVGKQLAAAIGMMHATFELGDSGALIVMPDADLPAAARAAAAGAFATSGQSCRGVKRILAHDVIADELISLVTDQAAKLTVGDPADPQTDIGTLIDEPAAVEVERRVRSAVQAGAQVVHGGQRRGAQYWPTVLDRVPADAELAYRETFGPCAPVIRFDTVEAGLALANETGYGLQAGIFSNDLRIIRQAVAELQVGTVVINDGPQFEAPNIPFGGIKDSGLGREGARYSIAEMTRIKTVVL